MHARQFEIKFFNSSNFLLSVFSCKVYVKKPEDAWEIYDSIREEYDFYITYCNQEEIGRKGKEIVEIQKNEIADNHRFRRSGSNFSSRFGKSRSRPRGSTTSYHKKQTNFHPSPRHARSTSRSLPPSTNYDGE